MMINQTPTVEQPTGFAFDSNDFAMTFTGTCTLMTQHQCTSMEEWSDDENEDDEEIIIEPEIDPDLEDGEEEEETEVENEDEELTDDDDEFEQYLFGEDDE